MAVEPQLLADGAGIRKNENTCSKSYLPVLISYPGCKTFPLAQHAICMFSKTHYSRIDRAAVCMWGPGGRVPRREGGDEDAPAGSKGRAGVLPTPSAQVHPGTHPVQ